MTVQMPITEPRTGPAIQVGLRGAGVEDCVGFELEDVLAAEPDVAVAVGAEVIVSEPVMVAEPVVDASTAPRAENLDACDCSAWISVDTAGTVAHKLTMSDRATSSAANEATSPLSMAYSSTHD